MARIRYLKPDFFKDEDLAVHPYWIRLLFAGLWNIADKEGRLEDRPKRIKVDLFPYDNVDINNGLEELAKLKNGSKRPFIQRYEIDGERYIQIVNWNKHQKPHHTEQESKIPIPPTLNTMGMEKGMEKQHEAGNELRNGEATVKKPLLVSASNTTQTKFSFLNDEKFKTVFNEYLEMRKKIRKPATNKAIDLALNTLHKYDLKVSIGMLEQSIMNSWTGIFPLKNIPTMNQQKIYATSPKYETNKEDQEKVSQLIHETAKNINKHLEKYET